ncbi:hypothetical protein [Xanthobacter sp. YC-JY1]|uniref:hypothetical protein n=1 Tax=Xanthobacter sp. YC-JY1 TaxID=2419844 RepID=UPI001F24329D|nr:hypothetical protein [Xanthobacter sp. YC-JY1]
MTRTDLIANNAARWSISAIMRCFSPVLYQPAWRGVFETLYAAADRQRGGGYPEPDRLAITRAYPTEEKPPQQTRDTSVAARLQKRHRI